MVLHHSKHTKHIHKTIHYFVFILTQPLVGCGYVVVALIPQQMFGNQSNGATWSRGKTKIVKSCKGITQVFVSFIYRAVENGVFPISEYIKCLYLSDDVKFFTLSDVF